MASYPKCLVCGRGVVAGQTRPDGRPAHISCQDGQLTPEMASGSLDDQLGGIKAHPEVKEQRRTL